MILTGFLCTYIKYSGFPRQRKNILSQKFLQKSKILYFLKNYGKRSSAAGGNTQKHPAQNIKTGLFIS